MKLQGNMHTVYSSCSHLMNVMIFKGADLTSLFILSFLPNQFMLTEGNLRLEPQINY